MNLKDEACDADVRYHLLLY